MLVLNLHIEKASGNNCFMARLCAEDGEILAREDFCYEIDMSVLARLEDSVGMNIERNSKLINKFGSTLFNAVFSKSVLARYQSLRDSSLRLKLVFEKDEVELLRIPWEFMFDGKDFLSANRRMTLTRALKRTSGGVKKEIADKLKTLAVIPSPLDLPEFYRPQAERERLMMREALDRNYLSDNVEVDFLERSTVGNVAKKLKSEEYHILHLTCHGVYSRKEHKCYLLFEDDLGNTERVDSETIAVLLAGHRSLRLVVLSGCHTVLAVGHRVLGELPVSLLLRDIPSVIVMQYSVTAQSAVTFARQLFAGICRNLPLDLALTNTRRALFQAGYEGPVDFASPILYDNHTGCLLRNAQLQCAVA